MWGDDSCRWRHFNTEARPHLVLSADRPGAVCVRSDVDVSRQAHRCLCEPSERQRPLRIGARMQRYGFPWVARTTWLAR
ncbi:hypothetical protein NDU88_001780 [Pleurodeles waltl]|uniref:Uncharacterized protein n=1 Tax=Pleurodeles waltl TaxID=8319 RepID=A0AAV7LE62_PLEWA|nr:hypothetical protein NDU88_001780 [Pleurodeles waltl]